MSLPKIERTTGRRLRPAPPGHRQLREIQLTYWRILRNAGHFSGSTWTGEATMEKYGADRVTPQSGEFGFAGGKAAHRAPASRSWIRLKRRGVKERNRGHREVKRGRTPS